MALNPNVKKKVKTTVFWSGLLSAVVLFIQSIAALLGYSIAEDLLYSISTSFNGILAILAFGGILVDPKEVDSYQAMMKKK